MNIPRYWKRVEKNIEHRVLEPFVKDGRKLIPISSWGYSSESEAKALENAHERISKLIASFSNHDPDLYYPNRVLHEDILRTIEGEENVITRNRYGSQVLNSSYLMFVDIDIETQDLKPPNWFQRLLGRQKKIERNKKLEIERRLSHSISKVEDYISTHATCGFRIYRTYAGLRLIATHKRFSPESEATQKIFDALGCDPLYQRLCLTQKNFRARLTPKPWRMSSFFSELLPTPRLKYRITKDMLENWSIADEDRLLEYDNWVRKYENCHDLHSTCHFVRHVGNPNIDQSLSPIIALHDELTQIEMVLELA